LHDARRGHLKRRYDGGLANINQVPFARHDLLASGYALRAIQTTRGSPLSCKTYADFERQVRVRCSDTPETASTV